MDYLLPNLEKKLIWKSPFFEKIHWENATVFRPQFHSIEIELIA